MNLPLKGGQQATLRDRLTYAQARSIRVAMLAANDDKRLMADLDMVMVKAYVSSWNVLDVEGKAVPVDQPELAPDDVIQAIQVAALELWSGEQGVPKAGNGTSPSLPLEPPSETSTTTSATSSFSATTPAGTTTS
jgi:hypothetical protein